MGRPNEFSLQTKEEALARQGNRCGSCGKEISGLGREERLGHLYGEGAQAHHIRHVKQGGSAHKDNCVVLCQSCHYSAHEGGRYRFSILCGSKGDYPHFNG